MSSDGPGPDPDPYGLVIRLLWLLLKVVDWWCKASRSDREE
jgi:hypothetical protein